jgi:hypothetical protein
MGYSRKVKSKIVVVLIFPNKMLKNLIPLTNINNTIFVCTKLMVVFYGIIQILTQNN